MTPRNGKTPGAQGSAAGDAERAGEREKAARLHELKEVLQAKQSEQTSRRRNGYRLPVDHMTAQDAREILH